MNSYTEDGNDTERDPLVSQQSERARMKVSCLEDAAEIYRDQLTPNEQETYFKLEQQLLDDYAEVFKIFTLDNSESIPNKHIPSLMQALGESPSDAEM